MGPVLAAELRWGSRPVGLHVTRTSAVFPIKLGTKWCRVPLFYTRMHTLLEHVTPAGHGGDEKSEEVSVSVSSLSAPD